MVVLDKLQATHVFACVHHVTPERSVSQILMHALSTHVLTEVAVLTALLIVIHTVVHVLLDSQEHSVRFLIHASIMVV